MEIDVIHKISDRDFIAALLTNKDLYAKFSNKCKADNFFLAQRAIAKAYPLQVNAANINGIDTVAVLDMYHAKLCQHGVQRLPNWLYTKGTASAPTNAFEKQRAALLSLSNWEMSKMLAHHGIELRGFKHLIDNDINYAQELRNQWDAHFAVVNGVKLSKEKPVSKRKRK